MKKGFLTLMLLFYGFGWLSAQYELVIDGNQVPYSKGKISAALYISADSFLKFDEVFASTSAKATEGKTRLVMTNIPSGNYAIALFHDKNDNDILDTNWMGIPKEKVAFSKAKMKLFGPPSFEDCTFGLTSDMIITIDL